MPLTTEREKNIRAIAATKKSVIGIEIFYEVLEALDEAKEEIRSLSVKLKDAETLFVKLKNATGWKSPYEY